MKDAKTIYAQSSDIKSRTYLEYRRDMKQKAIAELEILPWLRKKIQKEDKTATVEKYGGDRFMWFLRKGGITRDPDFIVKYSNGKVRYIETQYAKKEIKAYDFKISKIAPKDRKLKKRVPKKDTTVLYVIKPIRKYCIIEPEWIIDNSKKAIASAWGNAPVFRVNSENFDGRLKGDISFKRICELIDMKIEILDFQHNAIDMEKDKLSYLLQQVVDENKIMKIIPKTLDGFFKVCFMLDNLNKTPENANLWLVYLLSFTDQKLNSYELFQLVYCLDFLYPRVELEKNEIDLLVKKIKQIKSMIDNFAKSDGSYQSDKKLAQLEDTRYSLFVINLIEDLIQDMLHYYGDILDLNPIKRIYENVADVDKTYEFITK
ncbi:hypothetical protein BEH94_04550 [Candidatus Altiarchaeales archaeon WOR_SM1_SCG]|nr:hypothetical protein BEH94_04550 [Candidatus Altiarchaeales archaeon WOR_SM1_SCG]